MSHDNAAPVDGAWSVTIHGPTGPQETRLELTTTDGALGGTQSALGQVETIREISYNGASGTIVWVNKISKPLPLTLRFEGIVEDRTMSGTVAAGFMGSFPFTAVKL